MAWTLREPGLYELKFFAPSGQLLLDATGDLGLCRGLRAALAKRKGLWCLTRGGKWVGMRAT